MSTPALELTKEAFTSDQDVRWCPGCGDYAILSAMQKALPELGRQPHEVAFISGIGCSSRFPYYMATYGFHTIHGRAPAIASGLRAVNPDLLIWVVTGDGDGLSIGGNHLIHALRRNVDLNYLLFNNRIYGLTKGQASPTSQPGLVTKSTPFGAIDRPLNPMAFALGCGVTWYGRTIDRDLKHIGAMIKAAPEHDGGSFLEIMQNCIVFNDGVYEDIYAPKTKADHILVCEEGQPLVFGQNGDKALVLEDDGFMIVARADVDPGQIAIHDGGNLQHAWALAQLVRPLPIGILYRVDRPIWERQLLEQEAAAIAKKGPGDLDKLMRAGVTWEVR